MVQPGGALNGSILLVIGNLWWRIVMELLFRIHDSLQSIERQGRR